MRLLVLSLGTVACILVAILAATRDDGSAAQNPVHDANQEVRDEAHLESVANDAEQRRLNTSSGIEVEVRSLSATTPTSGTIVAWSVAGEPLRVVSRPGPATFIVLTDEDALISAKDWRGHYDRDLRWVSEGDPKRIQIDLEPFIRVGVEITGVKRSRAKNLRLSVVAAGEVHAIGARAPANILSQYKPSGPLARKLTLEERPPLWVYVCAGPWILGSAHYRGEREVLRFDLSAGGPGNLFAEVRLCVRAGDTQLPPDKGSGGVYVRNTQTPPRGIPSKVDASGCVSVSGVSPGEQYVHLKFDGYASSRIHIDLRPGSVEDLGVVQLEPVAQVLGSVFDAEGKLLTVGVRVVDPTTGASVQESGFIEDYFGEHFALDGLSSGEQWIAVDAPGYAMNPEPVSLGPGLQKGVKLQGKPGVEVELVSKCSSPQIAKLRCEERFIFADVIPTGSSEQLCLLPGRYELLYADAALGQDPTSVQFDVVENEPSIVTLR